MLFNFSDTCFSRFFDTGYGISNSSTRFAARLGLYAQSGQDQALRFSLTAAGLDSAQARIAVRSSAAVRMALRLGLSDITTCAWRLALTARPLTAQSIRAAVTGGQESRFQTVLRIRVIERFTN